MKEDSIIAKKSFDFALSIIQLYSQLKAHNEYVISKQLLRAGTSIGANVVEASAAQSARNLYLKCLLPAKRPEKPNIGCAYCKAVTWQILIIVFI